MIIVISITTVRRTETLYILQDSVLKTQILKKKLKLCTGMLALISDTAS